MHTIASPLPRPASRYHDSATMQYIPSLPYSFQDSYLDSTASRRVISPPELMSPFDLTETRTRTKVFKPQSPPPCTPTRRRRGPNTRSSRRRRQCTRTDCRFDAFGTPVAFDRLPWISAMEHSPDQLNTWDMADLSQLSAEGAHDEDSETSGPGPVRRRKTSLRTNPLGSGPESSSEDAPLRLRLPTLALDQLSSNPHTPVSQTFNHSEITFHDLLPVFPSQSHNDA